jgi:hypothetical protein
VLSTPAPNGCNPPLPGRDQRRESFASKASPKPSPVKRTQHGNRHPPDHLEEEGIDPVRRVSEDR